MTPKKPLAIWLICMVNVGKYTIPGSVMGMLSGILQASTFKQNGFTPQDYWVVLQQEKKRKKKGLKISVWKRSLMRPRVTGKAM